MSGAGTMPGPCPDPAIVATLERAGLLGEGGGTNAAGATRFTALRGGVSSDIWKVESAGRTFCVKRALARLRVAASWHAPVERNRYEVAWCRIAGQVVPGAAPRILHHDDERMIAVMEYLDPLTHPLWKNELRAGRAHSADAEAVGRRLARVHAGTRVDAALIERFPRHDLFHALRLEPYLEATAERHPELAAALHALSRRTAATREAMIHGDVSPKNILIGADGPVFLDAECACIGDPAFDLAFCLNHLLLKCLWVPDASARFLACFDALATGYLAASGADDPLALERRAATLLPGLLLARVDGKSPVEYVTEAVQRRHVRAVASTLLLRPPERLSEVRDAWAERLQSDA